MKDQIDPANSKNASSTSPSHKRSLSALSDDSGAFSNDSASNTMEKGTKLANNENPHPVAPPRPQRMANNENPHPVAPPRPRRMANLAATTNPKSLQPNQAGTTSKNPFYDENSDVSPEEYPENLNPFGEDYDETTVEKVEVEKPKKVEKVEENKVDAPSTAGKTVATTQNESTKSSNPFDEDDDEIVEKVEEEKVEKVEENKVEKVEEKKVEKVEVNKVDTPITASKTVATTQNESTKSSNPIGEDDDETVEKVEVEKSNGFNRVAKILHRKPKDKRGSSQNEKTSKSSTIKQGLVAAVPSFLRKTPDTLETEARPVDATPEVAPLLDQPLTQTNQTNNPTLNSSPQPSPSMTVIDIDPPGVKTTETGANWLVPCLVILAVIVLVVLVVITLGFFDVINLEKVANLFE
ncbi:hypothetical protein NEHOM01_1233 [Nematocida homosporus]|uniref:uncharacterized protein n=1 Tax=Nematocida homosporus TaxID=1912981 RepID=UPI00221F603B|nr:uncharacterized protein NEHOM01_1233 [Nematocida homosporus]KAI5186030.1 hypothetical protein NEHOM01_1233 [Nematocida homosporus]